LLTNNKDVSVILRQARTADDGERLVRSVTKSSLWCGWRRCVVCFIVILRNGCALAVDENNIGGFLTVC